MVLFDYVLFFILFSAEETFILNCEGVYEKSTSSNINKLGLQHVEMRAGILSKVIEPKGGQLLKTCPFLTEMGRRYQSGQVILENKEPKMEDFQGVIKKLIKQCLDMHNKPERDRDYTMSIELLKEKGIYDKFNEAIRNNTSAFLPEVIQTLI